MSVCRCLRAQTTQQAHNGFQVVEAAIAGGISVVQLRDKHESTRDMVELGLRLRKLTENTGVKLLVNDRIDVAMAIDADGVHVGQDDMPAAIARRLIGLDKILGVSAGTVAEARQAEADGADYIGVGAVYGTTSKSDAGEAIGVDGLHNIARSVSIPAVAIGGINAVNAARCMEGLSKGVAVISAIMSADDPASASRQLLEIVTEAREKSK